MKGKRDELRIPMKFDEVVSDLPKEAQPKKKAVKKPKRKLRAIGHPLQFRDIHRVARSWFFSGFVNGIIPIGKAFRIRHPARLTSSTPARCSW